MIDVMTATPEPAPVTRRRFTLPRWVWFAMGLGATVVGLIGIALPLLPTTGPLVIATACFARSSPRMEAWVLGLPGVGQQIADFRDGLGMRRRVKFYVVTIIIVAVSLSAWRVDINWVRACILGVGAIGALYVWFRVPNREQVEAERAASESSQEDSDSPN